MHLRNSDTKIRQKSPTKHCKFQHAAVPYARGGSCNKFPLLRKLLSLGFGHCNSAQEQGCVGWGASWWCGETQWPVGTPSLGLSWGDHALMKLLYLEARQHFSMPQVPWRGDEKLGPLHPQTFLLAGLDGGCSVKPPLLKNTTTGFSNRIIFSCPNVQPGHYN